MEDRAISICVYDPRGKETGKTYPPGSVWMAAVEYQARPVIQPTEPVMKRLESITRHRRECVVCGRTFYSKRKDARYHSPACRVKGHRRGLDVTLKPL